jgi:hypothetical protein
VLLEVALSLGLLCLRKRALSLRASVLETLFRSAGLFLLACGPLAGAPKIDDLTHPELFADRIP